MGLEFKEWKQLYGFDVGIMLVQMVPKNDSKWIRLKGGKGGSLEPDTGTKLKKVKVLRAVDKGVDRYFKLKGISAGTELIQGTIPGSKGKATMFITVRPTKTVAVGMRLWRSKRKVDELSRALDEVNKIFRSQANIRFTRAAGIAEISGKAGRDIKQAIGKEVNFDDDADDYNDFHAFYDQIVTSAAVTMFFVPVIEDPESKYDTNGMSMDVEKGSGRRAAIFIEDQLGSPLFNTCAHELGHYLGLKHQPGAPDNIMYSSGSCAQSGRSSCPQPNGNRRKITDLQSRRMHQN